MGGGREKTLQVILYISRLLNLLKCTFFIIFLAELKFAIETQGYKLLDVYEVQFYPRYDLTLFQNFLKSFFMMKVASKGKYKQFK